MATNSKPAPTRQPRTAKVESPGARYLNVCSYLVAIEDWDWSLSFGTNDTHH
jgi:hypothetical protein